MSMNSNGWGWHWGMGLGGAWAPTDIAGCKLWVDASQQTGLNDGDSVDPIPDFSTNDDHGVAVAATIWNTNKQNGLPGYTWTSDRYIHPITSPAANYLIVACLKPTTGAAQYLIDIQTGRIIILTEYLGEVGYTYGGLRYALLLSLLVLKFLLGP